MTLLSQTSIDKINQALRRNYEAYLNKYPLTLIDQTHGYNFELKPMTGFFQLVNFYLEYEEFTNQFIVKPRLNLFRNELMFKDTKTNSTWDIDSYLAQNGIVDTAEYYYRIWDREGKIVDEFVGTRLLEAELNELVKDDLISYTTSTSYYVEAEYDKNKKTRYMSEVLLPKHTYKSVNLKDVEVQIEPDSRIFGQTLKKGKTITLKDYTDTSSSQELTIKKLHKIVEKTKAEIRNSLGNFIKNRSRLNKEDVLKILNP